MKPSHLCEWNLANSETMACPNSFPGSIIACVRGTCCCVNSQLRCPLNVVSINVSRILHDQLCNYSKPTKDEGHSKTAVTFRGSFTFDER